MPQNPPLVICGSSDIIYTCNSHSLILNRFVFVNSHSLILNQFFFVSSHSLILNQFVFVSSHSLILNQFVFVSRLKIIKSNIIFFVCKNAIVVCLLIYRLIVVGIRMNEDVDDDSDDGMDLFYKEYVMTHNHRGSRWSERRTRASSASGRSVNSAGTSFTYRVIR